MMMLNVSHMFARANQEKTRVKMLYYQATLVVERSSVRRVMTCTY